jgi:hypothetical protein
MKFIALLFLLISFYNYPAVNSAIPPSNEGWELKKEKKGVKVFTKKNPETAFNLLKTECFMPYTLKQLLSVITDVEGHTKWVYNAIVTSPIKIISDMEFFYYGETYAPWPASNRDLVFHVNVVQNPATKIIEINAISVPKMLPEVPGKVRVPRSNSHWILRPEPGGVFVTYTLDIDPGGSLPAWLVNMATVDGPYLSFEALKKVLKENDYKSKKFPNIVE